MAIQTKKRIQFMIGRPAINSTHVRIVKTGAIGPPGARNARRQKSCQCWKDPRKFQCPEDRRGFPRRNPRSKWKNPEFDSADERGRKFLEKGRRGTWQTTHGPGQSERPAATKSCP